MISFWDKGKMRHSSLIAFKGSLTKSCPCLADFLLLPSPWAKPSATESNCHVMKQPENLSLYVTCDCYIICRCICEDWWRELSPTSNVSQAPGNLDGEGRASGAWGILVLPPEHLISETNQNCMPQHQHLSPRQGQICLTMGRQQIHSRPAMMFKNICSLQRVRGGGS